MQPSENILKKTLYYLSFLAIGLLVYINPLMELAKLSFHSNLYSHFLLIPVVSLYFFVTERKKIFAEVRYSLYLGGAIVLIGLICFWIGTKYIHSVSQNDYLFITTAGFVAWIVGGFIIFYGSRAFKQALFPLLFLVFMVPIPEFVLEPLVRFLQVQSANAVHLVFDVVGVPYLREDMVFELPGIAIEVAKQCSGIRSSIALFITSVVTGYMFLDSKWRRVVLALSIFPITIFKNALRITALSLLAVYVDPAWLGRSWLHTSGGIPFFLLALVFLVPVLWLLRRTEAKDRQPTSVPSARIRKRSGSQTNAI